MKKFTCLGAIFGLILTGCIGIKQHAYFQTPDDITPYGETVAFYQSKADESTGEEALQYRLRETGRLLHDGMRDRAKQQLDQLKSLPKELADEKSLLESKLALLSNRADKGLKNIARIDEPDNLSIPLRRYYHSLLADAYRMQGKYMNAVSERIQLDRLLTAPENKMVNRREIWHILSRIPLHEAEAALIDAEPELKSWLSLNLISRQYRDDGLTMLDELKKWQYDNKQSMASGILQGQSAKREDGLISAPRHIALLLPLSGTLKGPGQAVRDGFMASYYKAKKDPAVIRFYDTNRDNVLSLYQKAVAEGAEFILGPLTKQNVEALKHADITVPTVALNETQKSMPEHFYQFAISPQDEAMQVANKAYDMGKRHVLVIAPKGTWGESIAKSFVSQWEGRKGRVVNTLYYDDKTSMNAAVKQLLHITPSEQRDIALQQVLGKKLKFIPRRRQDFDMIFMVAYPKKAREIRPLLRYYYAGNVPIYATSMIYAGKPDPHADVDLNGVVFAEMPWLLSKSSKLVQKNWPEQLNSYNRLFAIGQDAFLLTQQLNQLLLFPFMGLNDYTGTLYLDDEGKIRRQMAWGRFKKGVPYRLI